MAINIYVKIEGQAKSYPHFATHAGSLLSFAICISYITFVVSVNEVYIFVINKLNGSFQQGHNSFC